MIKPPIQNVDRALWRAVLEAAAGFTPVTAALSRIYQVTFPPKFEQDLAQWRQEVTDGTNDHEARLVALEVKRPKLNLSPDAMALASWLALQSESGMEDLVEYDRITAAFPEATAQELQDAAAELEMYGLAVVSKAVGHPVRVVTPTYALYALFDPLVHQTSPQNDAVIVAKAALALGSGDARELEAHLGWTRRRFNPAFALLLTLVHDGRVRKVIQPDYPSLGFPMAAEERVRFKALIAEATPGA